jgi:hypothetical protein
MSPEAHYPVTFAFKPYALQQEIIDCVNGVIRNPDGDPYRFMVAVLGRQSGKSLLDKMLIIDQANNKKKTCMWVAPAIPTARSHWNDLVNWIEKSGLPVKRMSQAAKEIHFWGGGSISVRSAQVPDNLRGATLDFLILDEAAFFPNGRYIWFSVLLPMITASRGVVLFTTTPNGRNWLYELYRQGTDPLNKWYKSWRAPSTASPYQDLELLAQLKKEMHRLTWLEEFEAEFLADSGGVFVGTEEAAILQPLKAPAEGRVYMAGFDVGSAHDNSTATILDITEYPIKQVYGDSWNDLGTIPTALRIKQIIDLWQPEKAYMEKNSMGDMMFKLIKEIVAGVNLDLLESVLTRFANEVERESLGFDEPSTRETSINEHTKLIAIHMDNPIKRELVEGTALAIERGDLLLLAPDEGSYGYTQLGEMSTYIRERTQSGMMVTYNAKEGYMDDHVSALYLASKGIPRKARVLSKQSSSTPTVNLRGRNKHLRGGRR